MRLSKARPLAASRLERILDFDIEAIASGYGDPEWVPQKVTCVAWSWVGSGVVESAVCGPAGIYGKPERRRRMIAKLLELIGQADAVTGHNLERYDLRVVNAEAVLLGLEPIRQVLVQDTMRLVGRTKGLKKGQDNLGVMLRTASEKLALNHQQWANAYDEPGWPTVRERCESDVRMHLELRAELLARGLLRRPRWWRAT